MKWKIHRHECAIWVTALCLLIVGVLLASFLWRMECQHKFCERIRRLGGDVYFKDTQVEGQIAFSDYPHRSYFGRVPPGVPLYVDLSNSHLEGTADLKGLFCGCGVNVEVLDLSNQPVSDDDVIGILCIRGLLHLILAGTTIRGHCLDAVASHTDVEELYLNDTEILPSELLHLAGEKQLRVLNLSGIDVSDSILDNLHKALPNCRIVMQ